MTYRIRNWQLHFEKHENGRVKHMQWVPVPVEHDGKGYRRIIAQIGAEGYGAWVLMLEVAAKCELTRGTLADEDGPLTGPSGQPRPYRSMALPWRGPAWRLSLGLRSRDRGTVLR